jgi:hypothetical protein
MASARRPRTFSRPAATKGAEGGGVTTDREDDGGGDRYKQRKRKLADMLGPPWSEDELNLFYQGYRKYGKDWKKVNLVFFCFYITSMNVFFSGLLETFLHLSFMKLLVTVQRIKLTS